MNMVVEDFEKKTYDIFVDTVLQEKEYCFFDATYNFIGRDQFTVYFDATKYGGSKNVICFPLSNVVSIRIVDHKEDDEDEC